MIIDLDIGNSRIKWRCLDLRGESIVAEGAATDMEALSELLPVKVVERIRVSCVRRMALGAALSSWSRKNWNLLPEFATVQRECAGVKVFYEDVSRLGVDRWLAMLAAFHKNPSASCIIDCGTAMTVDFLDDTGGHAGGFIFPGMRLGERALSEHTEIRMQPSSHPITPDPGQSTASAVSNGAVFSALAIIEKAVATHTERVGHVVPVYLTGGDAAQVVEHIKKDARLIQWIPGLVLDGLPLALP